MRRQLTRVAYLNFVLLGEDQILRVIVLQASHVLADLLPYFRPTDVVHKLFKHLRLVVGLVDRNCDVDFAQVVFFAKVRDRDLSVDLRGRLVVENLSLPLQHEIPFVEEDEFALAVVGRRLALQLVELDDLTRQISLVDLEVE